MALILSAAEFKEQVATTLPDSVVEDLLTREQAAIERRLGPAYDGTAITETFVQELHENSEPSLFLRRRIESVTSITEKISFQGAEATLTTNDYHVIGDQGRIIRVGGYWWGRTTRRDAYWGRVATVTYIPQDDTAEWKRALVELGRTVIQRTAFKSENIAGEYSYTAPGGTDAAWEKERTRILQTLGFFNI